MKSVEMSAAKEIFLSKKVTFSSDRKSLLVVEANA